MCARQCEAQPTPCRSTPSSLQNDKAVEGPLKYGVVARAAPTCVHQARSQKDRTMDIAGFSGDLHEKTLSQQTRPPSNPPILASRGSTEYSAQACPGTSWTVPSSLRWHLPSLQKQDSPSLDTCFVGSLGGVRRLVHARAVLLGAFDSATNIHQHTH